jgi:crotonobetainyl-CoA:carnitine CoA-transferase CaiB-like acyl-CoA transferase
MLADLGAEVIKIERPGTGDALRQIAPATFAAINRGKRSATLDLRQPRDHAQLHALVRRADVVVEGFRPGVAARLGADYATLAALNPRLIYCSLSGYGQYGPYRDLPGHDLNYLGVAGALDPAPVLGEPPRQWAVVPMADLASALFATSAILAALYQRVRDGESASGAYLDVSLAGSALALMNARLGEARRIGEDTASHFLAGGAYRAFAGSDGRTFTVACIEDIFWQRLCAALGRADLAADGRWASYAGRALGAAELDATLADIFVQRPREEWIALLRAADVPVAPVNTPNEVERDPYVAASGLLIADDSGPTPLRAVPFPVAMPGGAVRAGDSDVLRAPEMGEYNRLLPPPEPAEPQA